MTRLRLPTALYLLAIIAPFLIGCAHRFNDRQDAARAAAAQARVEKQAADTEAARQTAAQAKHRFAAQVVGLQWLNPLQRRGYPTEWNLLWTLGLAKSNPDDSQVRKDPQLFSTVQSIGPIASNISGKKSFDEFSRSYLRRLLEKFSPPYLTDKHYFYSVAKDRSPWREVAGQRIELVLPPSLSPAENAASVRNEMTSYFGLYSPRLSTTQAPPSVRVHAGGPEAGLSALSAALDYLEENPERTVWVMAFDAPSFPKDAQLNETGVLLVLAHPDYPTGREPLAFVHRESRVPVAPGSGTPAPRIAAAWQAAFADAAERGNLSADQIGYVIHDAGQGSEAASERISALAQAMTEQLPDLDFLNQGFNTGTVLGELNAGSVPTSLVLGIAYAHHRNTPVLVAATRETNALPGDARALAASVILIRPPAHPTPFDPKKNWFRARGEATAHLPWWSRRHDAPADRMQGWSD
jgi:lysophospholipase L1-like esterase